MWQTIGNIFLNYWVEFALAGFVTVVGFFIKKYLKLNNEALERNQKEYHDKIQTDIIDKNQEMINQVIENSKADDRAL